MSITVLYFAALKEAAGCAEQTHVLCANGAQLFAVLSEKYPFGYLQTQLRIAVNGRFADWQTPLHEGDVVAFIPPVSGG
jgi:molybdopterin synthase sulfur carrier subunit